MPAAPALYALRHMGLSVGTRLGLYEVLGTLGAGGMGEVYRARDTRLQRDVALRTVAAFEGAKGLLVMATGLGLLSLLHHDVQRLAGPPEGPPISDRARDL